jgi:hypothetical protein
MDSHHLLHRAIVFSERAHRGQMRKGTNSPYVTHPLAVGMMVLAHGHSVEAAVVGLLHDVLEDTPVERDEIDEAFGPDIALAVVDLSESDKTLPWEERKQGLVARLATASEMALPACAADKIHNLKSILWDLDEARETGLPPHEVWRRFKRPPRQIAAFNRAVERCLRGRGFSGRLVDLLDDAIIQFARTVDVDPAQERFTR